MLAVTALLAQPAQGEAGGAPTWSTFLGMSPSDVAERIAHLAKCSKPEPLPFSVKSMPERVEVSDFGDWWYPTGGGFVLPNSYRSDVVSTLSCELGERTNLLFLSSKDAIFSLEVVYLRCGTQLALSCEIEAEPVDEVAAKQFGDQLVLVPFLGYDSEPTVEEFDRFDSTRARFSTTAAGRRFFEDSTDCFLVGLNSLKWRCRSFVERSSDTAHGVAIIEVFDDLGSSSLYVARQVFANLGSQELAIESYVEEVNAIVNSIKEDSEQGRSRQFELETLMQTVE
jgi:hypothetical protein